MISRIRSACTAGVEAVPVDVEVRTKGGNPRFTIIGLGGGAIKESRDRVISALASSGFSAPDYILVNLAPAELKKEGAGFDLAICLGVLVAEKLLEPRRVENVLFIGEVSLDGTLKPVRGVTAMAVEAYRAGMQLMVVPLANFEEARVVPNLKVVGAGSIAEVVKGLSSGFPDPGFLSVPTPPEDSSKSLDDVVGQEAAKRALLVAAVGNHNLLMLGPPGCGKSMLAERLPTLLELLNEDERLEVVKIRSLLGMSIHEALAGMRPVRSPHHTTSDVGLFGGGQHLRPGEITLAHRGILFLDEFPEFRRSVLEALRTPLETRKVSIARATGSVSFPAHFQLVAAMNPCPCGRLTEGEGACRCSQAMIAGYLGRLSQPILDRIDLHIELKALSLSEFAAATPSVGLTQNELKQKLRFAIEFRLNRGQSLSNAEAHDCEIKSALSKNGSMLLTTLGTKLRLSARGAARSLRVARSIADLESSSEIKEHHVAEALTYRKLERITNYVGTFNRNPHSWPSANA